MHQPKVSIGLPVYNGENYLENALDSLLAQTFTDYEVILSDNGSTDCTAEICERYARQDERIRYSRSEINQGAAWNFNRVLQLAKGEYFKWMAHDDLIAPTYLERCVEILDRDSSVVLAHTRLDWIDAEGKFLADYTINLNTGAPLPRQRYRALLLEWHMCFDVFGLIRTDALRQTPGMGNYGHADGILLEQLAMLGRFQEIPEVLFWARRHEKQSMVVYANSQGKEMNYYTYAAWYDPKKQGKLLFPTWRIWWENIMAFQRSSIPLGDRFFCFLYWLRWTWRKRRYLLKELAVAGLQLLNRVFRQPRISETAQRIMMG